MSEHKKYFLNLKAEIYYGFFCFCIIYIPFFIYLFFILLSFFPSPLIPPYPIPLPPTPSPCNHHTLTQRVLQLHLTVNIIVNGMFLGRLPKKSNYYL